MKPMLLIRFLDTPAINSGEKSAHLFIGKKSKLMDAYKSNDSSSAEFLKCLQDWVQFRGCPTGLDAPMYRGWKNSVYHRDVILPLWQCESKYQHQNYAENRWQTVKRYTNRVMNHSGCRITSHHITSHHITSPKYNGLLVFVLTCF